MKMIPAPAYSVKSDVLGIERLYSVGAKIFPVNGENKKPMLKGYLTRRYPLDMLMPYAEKGYPFGIVPASIGLTALDVDSGILACL